MIRIIVKVENFGPDGTMLAPDYRTVDIEDAGLEEALKPPGSYANCTVVGAERRSVGKSAL
jgi:hypothetical protein